MIGVFKQMVCFICSVTTAAYEYAELVKGIPKVDILCVRFAGPLYSLKAEQ